MTHPAASRHPAQRSITISIAGTDKHSTVSYTYWSPVTGHSFVNAPECNLKIIGPTYCLFLLDYQSTLAGWTIEGTKPYGDSPKLKAELGPADLSISTYNPYDPDDADYRFYIKYKNTVTGAVFCEDPQEGNIPP